MTTELERRLALLLLGAREEPGAPARAVETDAILGALAARSRPGEHPAELLLDLGLVGERDFAAELASRARLPFQGLRGFVPDPRLFLYVPLPLAHAQRVCPLVLVGSSLKLATVFLEPALDPVRERFPNLELELVVSPRGELLEALRRAGEAL